MRFEAIIRAFVRSSKPFRQGERRFDRADRGLGLELAITKQLVELHGGTISAPNLKVLVVDDEPVTLEMFYDALESAGADVRSAATGTAALPWQRRGRRDLIVTDLGLPGMDGYELLAAIRAIRPAAACPAGAVGAYARLDDRSRALAAGFQAHVAKPIEPPALMSILCSALAASD